MHLVSQIPGHPNYIGGGSNGSGSGSGTVDQLSRSTTFSGQHHHSREPSMASTYIGAAGKRRSTQSKPAVEEDGWQTVKKRR